MSIAIIQDRLLAYQSKNKLEQENAIKEIMQEIALLALSRSGFFRVAAFQGGTCLRILYGLERFSEDLDFVLVEPNKKFIWRDYIKTMQEEFLAYGYQLDVVDRDQIDKAVKVAFLKTDSAGALLNLRELKSSKTKLRVKLEIDTHPPAGSNYEMKFLDFPLPYSIRTQDLPSLFAGKCHALLCRKYLKGRDWFDFSWYVTRRTLINFNLLHHAIYQAGPWRGEKIKVTAQWFLKELKNRVKTIDWNIAKQDVARFLKEKELSTLELWSTDFFLSRVQKLQNYLSD